MVCKRCIKVLKDEFEKLQIEIQSIELGKIRVAAPLSAEKLAEIQNVLTENGFELIDDKKSQLIDQIKTLIIEAIHYNKGISPSTTFSSLISKEIGYDYSYLSNLFSSVENITIEKYIILQKVEKIKELLIYDQLSLKEIAFQLGYSSVQHLSTQFKKVTGLTPSFFKKQKNITRKSLDEV